METTKSKSQPIRIRTYLHTNTTLSNHTDPQTPAPAAAAAPARSPAISPWHRSLLKAALLIQILSLHAVLQTVLQTVLQSVLQTALQAETTGLMKPHIEHLYDLAINPSTVQLYWEAPTDGIAYYQVETSKDLSQGFIPYTLIAKAEGIHKLDTRIDIATRSQQYFYRITEYPIAHAYLAEDSDTDGLSNQLEADLQLNPYFLDSDRDSYHDLTEYSLGSDPLDTRSVPSGRFINLLVGLSDPNRDDDIWKLTIDSPRIHKIQLSNKNPISKKTTYFQVKEGEEFAFTLNRVHSYEKFTDEYQVDLYAGYGGGYPPVIATQASGTLSSHSNHLSWFKSLDWTNDNQDPPDPSDKWRFYVPLRTLSVSDPSEKAGIRESTEKIVLVKTDNTKPTVSLKVEDPCIKTPSGYPMWSNRGLENYHGQRSAQLTTGSDTTIVAYLDPHVKTRPITIEVVDENKFEANWDFDSEHFQSLQKAINTALQAIGDTELSLSGTIAAEFKRVDYYNDPARYGHAAQLTGSLSASFPDISITSPPVPIAGTPAYMTFSGGFEGTKITLSASTDYDQSRVTPGQVSGTLKGKSTGVISSEAAFNMVVLKVIARAYGSATFNASGTLSLNEEKLVLSGSIGASDLTAGISADVEVGKERYEGANFPYVFDYAASEPFSYTLYTFQ